MPGERRTIEEIRGEIASERAQLEAALTELRRGVDAKRKPVVGLLALVLVSTVIAKVTRRLGGG